MHFCFFLKQFPLLQKKISDFIFEIKNLELIKNKKCNEIENEENIKDNENDNDSDKREAIDFSKKIKKLKKKKKKKKLITIQKETYANNINKNDLNININNNKINDNNEVKNEFNQNENYYNINAIIETLNIPENESRRNINKKFNEQNKIEKLKIIMEYKEDEINELSYDLAIEYDKRTYCKYYLSLLKTKHDLIFSFIYKDDYNSRLIKIDLFFVSFTLLYTINALFYSDDTMHKIYEDKGTFDFIYQLPKTIYSSLISIILSTILKFLALSNDAILEFKKNKSINNLNKDRKDLENKLRIKFILYFIISSLSLIFFWYYISMFGAIYKNTQYHLLKDTLISFVLSLIYPFGIYLIPGVLRIHALSDHEKKRICLYKLSKILQMF